MMTNSVVFVFIYLLGRQLFFPMKIILNENPGKVQFKFVVFRMIFGLTLFMFADNLWIAALTFFLYVLATFFDTYAIPKHTPKRELLYLFHLFIGIIVIPKLITLGKMILPDADNSLNKFIFENILHVPDRHTGIGNNWHVQLLLVLSGYIITLKEGTILIRLILKEIEVTPVCRGEPNEPDLAEYERGRLTGLLERTFFYFVIRFNQSALIAFIIALKSLARFKELNDKQFAEYFLIGSLLSLLWSAGPAIIVRYIMYLS